MKSACCLLAATVAGTACYVGVQTDQSKAEADVRAAIAGFITAFNNGDVEGVAARWAPNAQCRTAEGEEFRGRDAIRNAAAAAFALHKGMKLDVGDPAVRLISPDVAVEEGVCTATMPDGAVETTEYVAIHVLRDGKWLMESLRETALPQSESSGVKLKDLEWLAGRWQGGPDDARVTLNVDWARNKAFLISTFHAGTDRIFQEGTQVVGWDPEQKTVRSWVFDSDGGFGGAVWTRKGDGWQIRASATLPDGEKATAVHFIKPIGNDQYSWKSVGRRIGSEVLTDLPETIFTRMPPEKEAAK